MNAQQARELTSKNLSGPVIEPFLKKIYEDVEKAAKEGRYNITLSFGGHRKWPSHEEQRDIHVALDKEGFLLKDYDDPDPGHPCSTGGYTTLSW